MKKDTALIFISIFMALGATAGFAQETVEEWTVARMAYAKSEAYKQRNNGIKERGTIQIGYGILTDEDLLKLALKWLEKVPTDLLVNSLVALTYQKLGKTDEANKYFDKRDKIYRSIYDSGNGMTPETGYLLVTVNEAYDFTWVMAAKDCKITTQPGNVDRADCLDSQNQPMLIYFKYVPEYWATYNS